MPEPQPDLRGLRVLVTRPADQAEALCRLIEAAGGVAICLPMLAIAPVADPAAVAAQLAAARGDDLWIFSSANAVRHAAALDPGPWPALAAVGAVTAAALAALGHRAVLAPACGDGATALLAEPALAVCTGKRMLLVAGEEPLPDLAEGLRARGAEVALAAVYRRVPVAHAPQKVAAAVRGADVAIVSSAAALVQLQRLMPVEAAGGLVHLQLALPSPRVVEKARALGFTRTPLLPSRVTDAAYLDVLQRWHAAIATHHS